MCSAYLLWEYRRESNSPWLDLDGVDDVDDETG